MKQLKDQLAVEKLAWEENHLKKQDAWAASKERELRDHVRKERDHEIELVIQRLEEDNQAAREECQRVADNRIKFVPLLSESLLLNWCSVGRRMRDKYEAEISELERSERQTMEKYNQTKVRSIYILL
jgi:5-azacytidine-induced protein 1